MTLESPDPFLLLTRRPSNESPEDEAQRVAREAEAKRINDEIDEALKLERALLKKEKCVRILLLGQSESGKSTTLKNLRMKYARSAWEQERKSWRSVIQLNVLQSVNTILDILNARMGGCFFPEDDDEFDSDIARTLRFTDKHQLLKLRLAPVRRIETDLQRRLCCEALYQPGNRPRESLEDNSMLAGPFVRKRRSRELFVRSWQSAIEPGRGVTHRKSSQFVVDEMDNITEVIARCKEDMKTLWEDEMVQEMLSRHKLYLADSAGFFLDDLDRIATRDYEPSDEDVVRARLRTIGVQEYRLRFEERHELDDCHDWIIYDVGGASRARKAWIPYFEHCNALIFLAAISCFDETLAENHRVNRLEDSFLLWRAICSSKLLAQCTMIIFLNKCDLLREKLKRRIRFSKYLPSYGDKPNELSAVVKYLSQMFSGSFQKHTPVPRQCYLFATSVTDTKATAVTLSSVRDGILRENLKQANFV